MQMGSTILNREHFIATKKIASVGASSKGDFCAIQKETGWFVTSPMITGQSEDYLIRVATPDHWQTGWKLIRHFVAGHKTKYLSPFELAHCLLLFPP